LYIICHPLGQYFALKKRRKHGLVGRSYKGNSICNSLLPVASTEVKRKNPNPNLKISREERSL